jgi:hypothetical protein
MSNYDSIHLPPWRARARRAGVRSNPGGDLRQSRSELPAGPAFPPEPESAPPDSPLLVPSSLRNTHAGHLAPIEIP